MQIKNPMRYHNIPSRIALVQGKQNIISAAEEVKKLESLYIRRVNVKKQQTKLWSGLVVPQKLKQNQPMSQQFHS